MTESGKAKVKRALELQKRLTELNRERRAVTKELNEIMDDPYICDKVNGLKMGGII